MATPEIQQHFGAPLVYDVWEPMYDVLNDGALQSVSETRIVYATPEGQRVVLSGSFILDSGMLIGGTVTGYDAYEGSAKFLSGSGYAIPALDLVAAMDTAITYDDNDPFWDLVWNRPLTLSGSDYDDYVYGNNDASLLTGGRGNDFLYGTNGSERMKGGAGNDCLDADGGLDRMWGGSGKDVFVITDRTAIDRIEDFVVRDDTIVLALELVEELGPGHVGRSEFHIGRGAATDDQHLIYNDRTGALYYDADGSEVAAKVQIAQLDRHLDLRANDFMVLSEYYAELI